MPTTNPVPSADPADLLFNAGKLDEVVSSAALTYTDRLGNVRLTAAGAIDSIRAVEVRGAWSTGAAYVLRDVVTQGGVAYICVVAHTAGTFATDLAAGKWAVYQGVAESDLISAVSPVKGAGYVGLGRNSYAHKTVGARLMESASVFDFMTAVERADVEAYTFGVDVTAAIQAALASGATDIYAPAGGYLYTAQLSIPDYVTLRGAGYGLFAETGATRFLKRGAFTGIVLNGASQLRNLSVEGDAGNTLDGVNILGGRSMLDGVSVFAMGRDGIKVGDYAISGANTNLWRITNCIARSNGRHGCHIAHQGETTAPDANAGIMVGFEATSNGADGLYIGESVDNQIYGLCSQSNTGWGFRLGNYARGNFIALPYTEFNGADGGFEVGADRNFLLGFRGGQINDGWVDNGASNVIWGRYGSVQDVPLHSAPEAFTSLRLLEKTTSGVWSISKEATTRRLLLDLVSSATADVLITSSGGGTAGLRFSTATHSGAVRNVLALPGITINFGSIPSNSSVDASVAMTGADSTYTYTLSATHALPAGITVDCFWNGSGVRARASNTTASAVTVNGTFNITALKVSA